MTKLPLWMRVLLGALVVLAAALIVATRTRRPATGPGTEVPADPSSIEIASAAETVRLEKKDGLWRLTRPLDWPADEDAVIRFLGGLRELAYAGPVTERAETHGLYEVSDASGVRVTVASPEAAWVFGKESADRRGLYARPGAGAAVYLAQGFPRDELERPVSRWRDRRLLPSGADIARAEFRRGKEVFVLERSSSGWALNGRDAPGAEEIISRIRVLSAEDFAEGPLEKQAQSLDVTLTDGSVVRLVAAPPAEGRTPVRKDGAGAVYLVWERDWSGIAVFFSGGAGK